MSEDLIAEKLLSHCESYEDRSLVREGEYDEIIRKLYKQNKYNLKLVSVILILSVLLGIVMTVWKAEINWQLWMSISVMGIMEMVTWRQCVTKQKEIQEIESLVAALPVPAGPPDTSRS